MNGTVEVEKPQSMVDDHSNGNSRLASLEKAGDQLGLLKKK